MLLEGKEDPNTMFVIGQQEKWRREGVLMAHESAKKKCLIIGSDVILLFFLTFLPSIFMPHRQHHGVDITI